MRFSRKIQAYILYDTFQYYMFTFVMLLYIYIPMYSLHFLRLSLQSYLNKNTN